MAQSPFEAAAALAARTGVPVIVELHGDWRTFARLYGSPLRRAARARRRRGRRLGGASCSGRCGPSPRTRRGWRARPDASRDGRVSRVHGPRSVRRSGAAVARADRQRSSSASWSRTRTSTVSPPPGGARSRSCPTPVSGSSAREHGPTSPESLVRDGLATWEPRLDTNGDRRCARRVERARPALALRGHGTRRDRGAPARPPGARQRRRRHPGPGHGRRRRRARRARPRRVGGVTRASCSRIRRRSRASPPQRAPPASAGS